MTELFEDGQMVYCTAGRGGHEEGVRTAGTKHAYVNYEMEQGALDFRSFRLHAGTGRRRPGARRPHRTPDVIATLPVLGIDEIHMRANFWVVQQTLLCGVQGSLLCHALDPEAAKRMVRAACYPNAKPVVL